MKRLIIVLILVSGIAAIAFASLNNRSHNKEKNKIEKKMEKKSKKKIADTHVSFPENCLHD